MARFHGKYYDFPPVRSFPKPVQNQVPNIRWRLYHGQRIPEDSFLR